MNYKNLKNKHLGKDCVILTCGPSLKEYSKDKIKEFLKGKIVICVKESVIEFKDECDYFFYNDTRMRKYDFNNKTIKIYQSKVGKKGNVIKHDIQLNEDVPFKLETQLMKLRNFDKYNLDNTELRPWGPGILYETVFYTCLYMGIKNVYTIGWDLIDTKKWKNVTHYFDNDKSDAYKDSKRWNHDFKKEMILVNDNVPFLYDYFKEQGMSIVVCGKQSFVNKHVPRIQL